MTRFRDWLAYHIFLAIPISWKQIEWIYQISMWLLPYVGNYAFSDDNPDETEKPQP